MRSVVAGLLFLLLGPELGAATDPVSEYLVERIQMEREQQKAPGLKRHDDVQAVAQQLADEVTRFGNWLQPDLSVARAAELLQKRKYLHHELITTYSVGGVGEPSYWVDSWIQQARAVFDSFHHPDLRDYGIGRGEAAGRSFYFLMVSVSRTTHYREQTQHLSDLDRVREELRRRVNEERRKERLRPMTGREVLDEVAQSYAEEMLRRNFYGHYSPEGKSVRDRTLAAGYRAPRVAENLAGGQTTVEQVMAGWMASPGHRANILHKRLRDVGTGLAIGEREGDFVILWVQVFGSGGRSRLTKPRED